MGFCLIAVQKYYIYFTCAIVAPHFLRKVEYFLWIVMFFYQMFVFLSSVYFPDILILQFSILNFISIIDPNLPKKRTFYFLLSTSSYKFSILNYQFSTINYQLSLNSPLPEEGLGEVFIISSFFTLHYYLLSITILYNLIILNSSFKRVLCVFV